MRKVWELKEGVINRDIDDYCGGNRILATLLANRGINTREKIKSFMTPLKASLISPDVFSDMTKTVERIEKAIKNNENITIWGDFDADGITSTALLYLTLKEIGAAVDYYIPNRETESHGLNSKALLPLISKKKSKLIITVDCGISNALEIKLAKSLGADIIITDHHEAPEILPEAFAIINPKAANSLKDGISLEEIQSLNYLAGVGVAFKLACALLDKFNLREFVNDILPLAAIGTIGDVVELLEENRTIVSMGLELISSGKNSSIQKLLKSAGIEDIQKITSENIAFYIVPRINAAGRLKGAQSALRLFITEDEQEKDTLIKELNDLNTMRQALCDEIFNEAKKLYEANKQMYKKAIILYNENWHIGIIGIVASKLVEEYNKPTLLLTSDTNNSDIIRCSCRSIEGINIHSILSEFKDLFIGFGGHKMAAGLSFDKNILSMEDFRKKIYSAIDEATQDFDFNTIKKYAEAQINPEDLTFENIEMISKLEPFGTANPQPVFVMNDLTLMQYKMMGQNSNHLKMFLSKGSNTNIEAVKWNMPDFNLPVNSNLDILFIPKENIFNDNKSIQLMVEDIHSDFLKENNTFEVKFLDHRNKKNILLSVLDFIQNTKKQTAIFAQNINYIKQASENITDKIFSENEIPENKEQLMFFEAPSNAEIFSEILHKTDAKIVHLMNFNSSEVSIENFISKLSGMLKYALTNMAGQFDINRISKALSVDSDTVDCALSLFEDIGMINIEKISSKEYKISELNPIELSKIKSDDLYVELKDRIDKINNFKDFYINSSVEEIKETLCR